MTKLYNAAATELCSACGLCCNGVIFANLALRPGDNIPRLQSLGLPVRSTRAASRPPHLAQPCAAFDGCHCRIYSERPEYCVEFECVLLKNVKAGRTEPAAALRTINTARDRADKVRRLLKAMGDTDVHLPLSVRFRRAGKRLIGRDVDEETADTYSQLTLAVHDLNLLLADAFYPGNTQPRSNSAVVGTASALLCAALILFAAKGHAAADQVELKNGDRYVGQVLSLNTNSIVLQSEVLGTLRLPRNKVAGITLGPNAASNSPAPPLPSSARRSAPGPANANATSHSTPLLQGLSMSTNLIRQVQQQFLSGAGPEANDKFNELLGGLISGELTVDDVRAQAKTAADQLRALQREGGDEAGLATDAYLGILDHFLKETAPSGPVTNASGPSQNSKTRLAHPGQ
ncbi:MAG TPA: YkgJ family cysteine cluster protein [Candidatus Paceibacterota bacterium]|nr:YkgJ family cysteine cluster protein [Verrucomicrobiota bacterium]HSA11856.1 YkgJ family cysteine cluster protein [Candidatus Paceibacterota bacterium]